MTEDHKITAKYEASGTFELYWRGGKLRDDVEITDGGTVGEYKCTCGKSFQRERDAEEHLYRIYGGE